jgi:hypothetical protein
MYTRSHENFVINVTKLIGRVPSCGYFKKWINVAEKERSLLIKLKFLIFLREIHLVAWLLCFLRELVRKNF